MDDVTASPQSIGITLGILAGGCATRLRGCDKAWLERDGVPLVLRLVHRFAFEVSGTIVSTNRGDARYAVHALPVVADRIAKAGPLGGLEALAHACRTHWLLTIPVDLVGVNECLLPTLATAAGDQGAFALDDDGPQPLVALWPTVSLREAAAEAIATGERAVHVLQARLNMAGVRFNGVRFGNLNTPGDLAAVGIAMP